ncbi:STAS domain-containing protein [Streptomyces sp. NPDC016845]|uniref:STAS domain-containing protein n=1 Tax=Streptomyces sp. NPDC016845 TaxID=3364972 RepID=UPI003792043D
MTLTHGGTASVLTEHSVGDTHVVALHGEIDVAAVPRITAHLDVLTTAPFPDVVVDLREVTFVDCAGLGALCRAQTRTSAGGGRLRLVTDEESLLRVLRMTDLSATFEIAAALPWEAAASTA